MKASELIENLKQEIEKHGDLIVVIWADHAQAQLFCEGAYMQESGENDDIKVIEIGGDVIFYES